jgi:C4-dicarboxylate-specific signal transduction histidine kinase
MYRDGTGKEFTSRDASEDLIEASAVPVYVAYNTVFGRGAVGGVMTTIEGMARQAAAIARRIGGGQSPDNLSLPQVLPAHPLLDWRQLKRFGVSESQLPTDSVVGFRKPSLWEAYRERAIAIVILCLLQAAIIFALLVQWRRRLATEKALRENQRRMESALEAQSKAQRDAEERRNELIHLSRVDTFGRISGSLAHEINQPLSAILTNTQVALKVLERTPEDKQELSAILRDIISDNRRANEIVVRLRNSLKKQSNQFERHELKSMIHEIVNMLKNELMFQCVKCNFDFHPTVSLVFCDRIQIQQVLLNLIKNAWEGMQLTGSKYREIVFRTRPYELNQWVVTVANNGAPIADSVLKLLFQSFVSTKEAGMGMGLAISRGIIENHHGRIWAENNPGGGATFSFTLPTGPVGAL